MRRLAAAPLFVQALALVVLTAVAAQLVMVAAQLSMEAVRVSFTLDDVAAAVRGEPEGAGLSVDIADTPPAGWETDDVFERQVRAHLAGLLGVPPARVLAERRIHLPGGPWMVRRIYPEAAPGEEKGRAFGRGGQPGFEELAVAVQLADGRWVIVERPSPWLRHVGVFVLVWLLASTLLLVPLAWRFTHRLVAPISAFAETAERAGLGDRDAVFPATGAKEIRTAGRALAEMQRRIAGAVEERTRLIAAVAHDLRTPLTRLRFRAEYAPPEHRDRIVQDIERMDAMIAGVLAFARGEERRDRQHLELGTLVQSMVDDLVETGADVAMADSDGNAVEVIGDPLSLRRLVANLLDNAIKYGGSARCRVYREGGDALVHVDDEGPGVPQHALERLFTPFERGDAARDPATGGMGLGLALARGIARAHGGDVWLSRLPSGGLRAHVRLPAAGANHEERSRNASRIRSR